MKLKITFSALIMFIILSHAPLLNAAPTNATAPTEVEGQTISESFKTFVTTNKRKGAKRLNKIIFKAKKLANKFAQALDVDLQDPIMKWLWYCIIALGAAVILYILAALTLGFLSWFAYLASLASSVCFVIWILKYLELM